MPTSSHLHPIHAATQSQSQELGTLDSASLPSEPPDIRNWFSSYSYESPELNASNGLHDLETCIDEEKKGTSGEIPNAAESMEGSLAAAKESSDGLVAHKEPNDFEHRKSASLQDIHDVELKTILPIQMDSTLERAGDQMLLGKTGSSNHGSVKMCRPASIYDTDDEKKLEFGLINMANDNTLCREYNTYNSDAQSHQKSIRRNNGIKESLGKENLYDVASPGTSGLPVLDGDCWRVPIEMAKENDGFISTRKKAQQANTGNVLLKDGVELVSNLEKEPIKSRKIISDKSDFYYPTGLESTGKWHCPGKKKPNLRPPLKQLRLEHWVRHV